MIIISQAGKAKFARIKVRSDAMRTASPFMFSFTITADERGPHGGRQGRPASATKANTRRRQIIIFIIMIKCFSMHVEVLLLQY
ncbi:hypothetical protein AXF42_Ash020592 [Apostasia shenzhenica]|uniref:Uncharacterized protein n=1 Tax=Apostasia shenzhenica TaxID=1088818 RepID=A0A2I0A0D7_9ASPA|nr:hypothetical protein AXF42_Ash020592 [Apostasia shenzhenica]